MAGDNDYIENLHTYGIDPRSRRIYLPCAVYSTGEAGPIGTDVVVRNLLLLDRSKGPIELWINTPGGYLHEMWSVIDVMHTMNNEVCTVALGNVSSAGCLMLAAGTGTRYALPHASFMWHAGTTDICGEHWPDARDRMKWEIREQERWIDMMGRKTTPRDDKGRAIKTLEGKKSFWEKPWCDGGGELWLDAKEMVQHGVVDEIWTKNEEGA